jgi:hypothetical protein
MNFYTILGLCCIAGISPLCAAWTAPVDLSEPGQDASSPQIAVDGMGNAMAVWQRSNGTNIVVQSATKPFALDWQSPVNVPVVSGSVASFPQLALDVHGNATVAWTATSSSFVVQASSKPYGGNWQFAPDSLLFTNSTISPSRIAVDPCGNVTLMWNNAEGTGSVIQSFTKPYGGSWQSPVDLFSLVSNARAYTCQIAVDVNGNDTVVWEITTPSGVYVEASTKLFEGTWQSIVSELSQQTASFNRASPQVCVDANGNATAVWQFDDGSHTTIQASSKPYGGGWQLPPDSLSPSGYSAINPQVAADPQGNITAVWELNNGSNSVIQASTKLYGWGWGLPSTLVVGQDAHNPQIVVDAFGNATVVWQGSNGTNAIIQASTKPYGGAWQTSATSISSPGQDAGSAVITVDLQGNVFAVWERSDGSNLIIQSSILYRVPLPPTSFTGIGGIRKGHLLLKTTWKRSLADNVVRYEILSRGGVIKTIPANEKLKATIHLNPSHIPDYFSDDYRLYLHNKYKVRAVDSSGAVSSCTNIDVMG